MTSTSPLVERKKGVFEQSNDILSWRPQESHNSVMDVFFFQGDVQDTKEKMAKGDPAYAPFSERFCLEQTAKRLLCRFNNAADIHVVCPASLRGGMACYDHLTRPGFGLAHLEALFPSNSKACEMVAFSRGCLVLNNFIAEVGTFSLGLQNMIEWESKEFTKKLPYFEPSVRRDGIPKNMVKLSETHPLLRCRALHFVDGHRFVTEDDVVKGFSVFARNSKIKLFLHTTSRQLSRDFVKAEFERFCSLLSKYEVDFEHIKYFGNERPSMEMHFRLLEHF